MARPLDPSTLPGRSRVIVAFSGGPDSVCLLHQLVQADSGRDIVCVHIDHGLDPESGERAGRASEIAAGLGVDCQVVRVDVEAAEGPEDSARRARYRALEARMTSDDVLVTAHHADDQAETVLLRLLRGAGPDGLAGIPASRPFGPGWLARPLLEWPRSAIEQWLRQHALDCIRDPANECADFDRNFLRREVLPALRERWPGVDAAIRRSGRLCGGAADFVAAHIESDLEQTGNPPAPLRLDLLAADSPYYRGAVIRAWCIRNRVEPPPGRRLAEFIEQLSTAAGDRCPELRWGEVVLRYWSDRLWLEPGASVGSDWRLDWTGLAPLRLPEGLGMMRLDGAAAPALDMVVSSGRPGDALQPGGDTHRRDCKRLLANAGVPPWQRHQWPRLWLDGRLVALGARWLEAEFQRLLEQRRQSLVWQPGTRHLMAGLESIA